MRRNLVNLSGIFVIMLGLIQCSDAEAEKEILASNQHLTAYVKAPFTCIEKLKITVTGGDGSHLSSKSEALKNLMKALRTRLEFDCEKTKAVMIEGKVKNEIVYRGALSESSNWSLVDLQIDNDTEHSVKDGPFKKEIETAEKSVSKQEENTFFSNLKKRLKETDFPLDGYRFPVLISHVYQDQLDQIPDDQETRSQVISIIRAFAENCGSLPANIALDATNYGVPQVRRMKRDGLKGLGEMLRDMAKMRDRGFETGDYVGEWRKYSNKYAAYRTEGYEDGKLFISRHGCNDAIPGRLKSNLFDLVSERTNQDPSQYDPLKFTALMSRQYREENNIPDPETEMRKRETKQRVDRVKNSCMARFQDTKFCGCALDQLKQVNLKSEDWDLMSANFLNIVKHASIKTKLQNCY